jgi:hypothetical protein
MGLSLLSYHLNGNNDIMTIYRQVTQGWPRHYSRASSMDGIKRV